MLATGAAVSKKTSIALGVAVIVNNNKTRGALMGNLGTAGSRVGDITIQAVTKTNMDDNFRTKLGAEAIAGAGNGSAAETEKEASVVIQAKWIREESTGRWWYRNSDGSYPKGGWWQDPANGIWYFFDEQGYMQTGWIDWNGKSYYCSENGDMLTNCMTPDNYLVGADGAWIAQ